MPLGYQRYVVIALALSVLGMLLGGFLWSMRAGTGAALAQSGPTVGIAPHALGQQEAVLMVTGTNLTNLGGFEFDLNVDPAVARTAGARLGPFLGSTGRTVGTLGPLLGSQGETIAFGGYSYDPSGNNAPGPNGDGVLAYITMTVAADGVSTVTLENLIVADTNATRQNVSVENVSLQVRTLRSGWNLIAPCVDLSGLGVMSVFASIAGNFNLVLGENGTYVVGLPDTFQTLREVTYPWAYYIRITSSQPVTFVQVAGTIDISAPITLTTGWRWVGYCGDTELPVSQALQSIDGKYDMVIGEIGTYVVGLPDTFQTLRKMRQGEGYLIRMTGDGVLTYPTGGGSSPRLPTGGMQPTVIGARCAVQNTPYMTLVYGQVRVNGAPAPPGTVVEAITPRGEVAGCFEVHTAGYFGVMQVYGADEEGGIPGFQAGEPITWRVNGQEAKVTPAITWQDDKAVHEVVLEVIAKPESSPQQRLFVPWLLK